MKLVRTLIAGTSLAALAGCGTSAGVNPPPRTDFGSVFVLNSVGKTIGRFSVGEGLSVAAPDIVLPENFDGDAIDVFSPLFVTTISSFGGSQLIFGSLENGSQLQVAFQGAGTAVNPGKATLSVNVAGEVNAWVAGRGTNQVFRATPNQAVASLVSQDVGEFVERVLPGGNVLVLVDANLDDEGGTFQPLGDARVIVINVTSGLQVAAFSLPGSVNARDAIFTEDRLTVMASGGFDANFMPVGNGTLVQTRPSASAVVETLPLGGNGLSLEAGKNGRVYVTTTLDFQSIQVLMFNPSTGDWVRGPDNPIQPVDVNGADIACWVATAMADGRLLCATFSTAAPGRLYLLDSNGAEISSITSGFGSTDIALR
ncbi:MAG: hypothetical protein ACE5HQ_01610 [Gemmatimonadota bacterium]